MKNIISNLIFHPFLLAIYPILFFYTHNQQELSIRIVYEPILWSLIGTAMLWLFSRLLLGNWRRGAVFSSICIFFFFFYGHFALLLKNVFIPITSNFILGPHKIFFPIAILLLILIAVKIRTSSEEINRMNRYLNILSIILFIYQVCIILQKEVVVNRSAIRSVNKVSSSSKEPLATPDIYYIILDAYARQDTLETIFHYDNSEFITQLEQLGFKVANNASSNYAHTPYSLSSSLNSIYVNEYEDILKKDPLDVLFAMNLIHQNYVAKFLKGRGYTVINFASGIGPTDNLNIADINYHNVNSFTFLGNHFALNEFYIVFLQTTALSPFIKDALSDQARDNIQYAFDKLTEIPYQRGNKFVIAHLNIPHPPFLFDENGNPIPDQPMELAGESFSDRENYLKQLKYSSKRTLETVEKILARSSTPPIIILQSDHGPATTLGHPHRWVRPFSKEGVKERMYILFAYYTPSKEKIFPDSTTPVNLFRILFNEYFAENEELLPDKNYFNDGKLPFEFLDVTDDIKDGYESEQSN